jgi:3',5'-cyclic-AMP phosphodiesterase
MKKRDMRTVLKSIALLLFSLATTISVGTGHTGTIDKSYYHLSILTDPHLPGANMKEQEQVIQTMNSWNDLDMVISLGDLCQDRGTEEEYASVKEFFSKLKKPHYPVVGNHDYIYDTLLSPKGKRIKAAPTEREARLNKFRETFGLKTVFYSREVGRYALVFLSTDHLAGELTEMSSQQMDWLRSELQKNNKKPTIIFFHAPLQGTLRNYNKTVNTPSRIAQPSESIRDVLRGNPQVFLWVSGHTHTSPQEESFASGINVYEKRITNIHNTNMNRETIWTNSLFLYPDRIIIKTYDHKKGAWLPDFDRTISPPPL